MGSHRTGDGWIFQKPPRLSLYIVINAYRKFLISAGSISLVSTFNSSTGLIYSQDEKATQAKIRRLSDNETLFEEVLKKATLYRWVSKHNSLAE
jgi:hypothetical protein